jgi:thermitase
LKKGLKAFVAAVFAVSVLFSAFSYGGDVLATASSGNTGPIVFIPPQIGGGEGDSTVTVSSSSYMMSPSPGTSPSTVEQIVENTGGSVTDRIPQIDAYLVSYPISVPPADVIEMLRKQLGARYVEPEYAFQLLDTKPNDPKYANQWAHSKIESPKAWDLTQGSSEIVVAIVDTGVDVGHPDLKDNLTPRSTWYDYGEDDDDPSDTYGHGTHCAGIAAAVGNNGEGVAGAGWSTSIMPVKVFPDGSGSTSTSKIAKGIVHAVDKGANVISLSLGSTNKSSALEDAINYAHDHNVLVVAAAGNDNKEEKYYPAAYDHVIAVAATDKEDKKASFSNYGTWVDISAPGVSILSTMPTYHVKMNDDGYDENYDYMSGTSMSTPLVAGVAALVMSENPNLDPDQVEETLENSTDEIDGNNPDYAGKLGKGRLNSGKAVSSSAPTEPTPTPTATPTQSSPTATPTPTPTPTQSSPTATPTSTPTSTPTQANPTATPTPTPKQSGPTATPTQGAPTNTPSPTTTPNRGSETATPAPTSVPRNGETGGHSFWDIFPFDLLNLLSMLAAR